MHPNVPKDRGWAWMVVLGAFLVNMLVVGVTAKSFGILFRRLKDELEHSSSATLFIVAITQCLAMVLGPFANMLVLRFSSRKVVFVGGLLMALGFILSRLAVKIYHLYFTYGILVGIGSAMAYAPSIITTMQYFDKRKALANGFAVAGGGIGNFAAPPLMQLLLDRYNLDGCFLILAGIMLHICLSGALFRPMSFYRPRSRGEAPSPGETVALSQSKPETCETICGEEGEIQSADAVCLLDNKPTTGTNKDDGYGTATEKSDVTAPTDSQGSGVTDDTPQGNGQTQSRAEPSKPPSFCSRLHDCCCTKPDPHGHGKRPVFEWKLFKNRVFLVYAFSMFFAFSGYPNIFQIILSHAQDQGIPRNKATFLVSIVGGFDVVGRIGFGWFSDLNLIQKKHGFMITMAIAGTACLFMPLAGASYEGLASLCAVFGLFAGSFYALLPAILVEALGEKKLPSAFGLVALFMGSAFIYATYVVGALNDVTGKWELSFYFSGVAMVLGAAIVLFEPIAVKYEAEHAALVTAAPPGGEAQTTNAV